MKHKNNLFGTILHTKNCPLWIIIYRIHLLSFRISLHLILWSNVVLLFSHSVMSYSLRPHELQPVGLSCPPLSCSAFSDSCLSDVIQPSHSLSPPSPPALNISQHQDPFQWVDSSHQVANDCSFSPSHESSGLISFRIDYFDLLAVQGAIKSLLQQHSLKVSIL